MEVSTIERNIIEGEVTDVLRTIFDPEIPVNIYELGLVYGIKVYEEKNVKIIMTLTSPACPVAGTLPPEVETKVRALPGIGNVEVEITWDPPWDMDMMSDEAKLELDML